LFRLLAKLAAKAASVQQKAPSPAKGADMRREIFENIVKNVKSSRTLLRSGPLPAASVASRKHLRMFRL
jgi:hypothetical protein